MAIIARWQQRLGQRHQWQRREQRNLHHAEPDQPGELVDLPEATACCGFGGTFAVKNRAVSTAMMADKLTGILASGAEVCTALDNSCLMHIGGGLARLNAGVDVLHVAEILANGGAR